MKALVNPVIETDQGNSPGAVIVEIKKKPSRRDLLRVITELQNRIGEAIGNIRNDRDPFGTEKGLASLERGHELCIQARSFDPPTDV